MVIPHPRVGSHALLTRAPLSTGRNRLPVRLACVRPAASVRSEPGSNSQVDSLPHPIPRRQTLSGQTTKTRTAKANRADRSQALLDIPRCARDNRLLYPQPPPPAHPFHQTTMSNSKDDLRRLGSPEIRRFPTAARAGVIRSAPQPVKPFRGGFPRFCRRFLTIPWQPPRGLVNASQPFEKKRSRWLTRVPAAGILAGKCKRLGRATRGRVLTSR